jgi:hypothetical protein
MTISSNELEVIQATLSALRADIKMLTGKFSERASLTSQFGEYRECLHERPTASIGN